MVVYGTVVVLKRGGDDGSRFPITATSCTFGRDPSCDIRISLATVAQTHCKLEVNKNGQVTLSDISKINQTLLNGISVKKSATLKHNDVISVADRKFRWECAPFNDKSSILKQNYRLKSNSSTPVGIVSPIRRDIINRETPGSKSARKAVKEDATTSKMSRRASVPSYYGDPILTPTFNISRQRRSKSTTNVNSANSSLKSSPPKSRRSKSNNIPSPSEEDIKKPSASKRSRSSTDKRSKMRKLDDENTIKIIAPSSPDHKKSAALRTIHGSKIAVEKNTARKLQRVKNYRKKKNYMVQRSEKVKQAVLQLHKTQPLDTNESPKQASRLMSVNEVKKISKGLSSPGSKVKDKLNYNVNLSNMFVSPLQTPNNQSVSYPMKKLISSMERKKRDIPLKSPNLSGMSSMFKTPEVKSPSNTKVTSTKKSTSPLKSPQSERSSSDSPPRAQTSRKSLRKSVVSPKVLESSSSGSPKTPLTRKSGRSSSVSRKSLGKSKTSPSPLKSPQSETSPTILTRRSSRPMLTSPRKSLANANNSPVSLSEASFSDSPQKPQMTRRSSRPLPLSPRKSLVDSHNPSALKSPQSEASTSDSSKKTKNSPKIQVGRRSMRKSTISQVVTPRKSISKSVSKSPIESFSPLRSPQSEFSSNESPEAKTTRKSSLPRKSSNEPLQSESSFSNPPVKTRRSTTSRTNSPLKSPKDSIHLSESSSCNSPITTRKSNISQRSSRRNSGSPEFPFSELESTFSSKRSYSSPRKSMEKLPENFDSSVSKSPRISTSSFYSPTKSPKRVSSDFRLLLSETRSALRSSILMKTPGSPSKLSPRKSLSYSTNEILLKASPVPEKTSSSKKSKSSTGPRLSKINSPKLDGLTLSFTPSPTRRKSNLPSPKRSISPGTSSERRSSRKVSRAASPIKKSPRRSESVSPKSTASPIKSPKRSTSISPTKPISATRTATPAKTRKSRSASPEKIESSPEKRTSLRASSKINLLAVVNIGSRNVKSPAVLEEAQKSPEDARKAKTTKALRSTPQGDLSESESADASFQKTPSVQKGKHGRQKKVVAKVAASIIQKSKRRSLNSSANNRSSAKIRQRGAKRSMASPNLSGLNDLFAENEDDGLQTFGSAKQQSPQKKVADTSPRRLRARTATPGFGLSIRRTKGKKPAEESKVTPQPAQVSPRGKALIKRKVILDSEVEDDQGDQDVKVQSPTKSPSPIKGARTSQRRVSKRGTKAVALKIDLTPIKETTRKRAKTSKLEAVEQEDSAENLEEKESNSVNEKVPKTPKKQSKAKKEPLISTPAEVPKSRKRGNKVDEVSPAKEAPKTTKRRKIQSDEPEISTAKTTRGRKAKKEEAKKSPDKSKEVKSVRASARLKNK